MAGNYAVLQGLLILIALAIGVSAHGGHLHDWTPTSSNYIRTKIASCNNWVPVNQTVKYSLVDAAANVTKRASSGFVAKGTVTVWTYLYRNCSINSTTAPTAGLEFNVSVSRNSQPLDNLTLDGVAMTGSCANGGGAPYYFNPAADPVDDDENLLWFHDYEVPPNGTVRGNGANDGYVSTKSSGGIHSVMLVNTETLESLACCDLSLAGPPDTDWAATLLNKGKPCEPEPEEGDAPAAHAGHDMAGMNMTDAEMAAHDHDHDHSNTTGNASAAASKSVAGAATAGAGVASKAAFMVVAAAAMAVCLVMAV